MASSARLVALALLLAVPAQAATPRAAGVPARVAAFRRHMTDARRLVLSALGAVDARRADRLRRWLSVEVPVRLGLPSGYRGYACNAFYDGRALGFTAPDEARGCVDASEVPMIVLHEFFHGVHDHLTALPQTFDPQLSEGVADFGASLVTGYPAMTGLTSDGRPMRARTNLRTCVNDYTYCRSHRCDSYPGDEPHNAGPILAAALWEMLGTLQEEYGEAQGKAQMVEWFLRFLSLATDMEASYGAAIAADEDDDDDPGNGTLHSCAINRAFLQTARGGRGHFPAARRHAVPCVRQSGGLALPPPVQ